ncbi:DegT/DnrJ/EryC1/StrS family aminotransferase [Alkalimarinus alittae]|uniref:DegT/DnrJ/EryC1/StrS family aminotransferase n=1 Tax=Alkalimarinus alittae TaxID=2961619 RepID=A0ABY6N607_9ALTE|nr:DegT/DnrJ/EryC1/StrS family aminotransferase [Alkalimarinus alittae]UZE97557.1 DegT/DnrJ/EryC1/StrS family aminotransferase [Alkalimarinus alittae]
MQVAFQNIAKLHNDCTRELKQAANQVIESGWYLLGKELESFETAYSSYLGSGHCAGVNSGLDALQILLKAAGVSPGDEVIVPSHTFIATWLAVIKVGATPVPVDPKPDTYNINPSLLSDALTSKTKAILVVHLYGHPCEMNSISYFANQHNLLLLEDAAQAHGALYSGKPIGTFGSGAAWSFYPGKNLGALGDGGAVTSQSQALIDKVKKIRNYGVTQKYNAEIIGNNSRLDELQAALLRVKLKYLDQWNSQRSKLAKHYNECLGHLSNIQLPTTLPNTNPVWHQYVIRSNRRDQLKVYLEKQGIQTQIHYPIPVYKQKAVSNINIKNLDLRLNDQLCNELLSLPISPEHSLDEVDYISECITQF